MQIKPESFGGKPEALEESVPLEQPEPVKKPVPEKPEEEKAEVKKPVKPGLNKVLIIAVGVVVTILIISVSAYLILPKEYFGIKETVPLSKPLIKIENLLLASSVDEDYNYVERESSTYTKGEIVTIYHEVQNIIPNLVDGEYQIAFFEVHKLFDPDDTLVPGIIEFNSHSVRNIVQSSEPQTVNLKSGINTGLLKKTGTYTYRMTVSNDFNPDDFVTKEISFFVSE